MHCTYAAREERTLKLPELSDASSATPDRHIAVVYRGYQRALRVPSARPDAPAAILLHPRRLVTPPPPHGINGAWPPYRHLYNRLSSRTTRPLSTGKG